jgi:hypothetical protein
LYKVNAPKLESALCLMEKFEAYQDIPKVQSLNEIVEVMTRGLHTQLMREIQLQWVVTDPMAGRSVDGNSSYEEKEAHRLELEQVTRHPSMRVEGVAERVFRDAVVDQISKVKFSSFLFVSVCVLEALGSHHGSHRIWQTFFVTTADAGVLPTSSALSLRAGPCAEGARGGAEAGGHEGRSSHGSGTGATDTDADGDRERHPRQMDNQPAGDAA